MVTVHELYSDDVVDIPCSGLGIDATTAALELYAEGSWPSELARQRASPAPGRPTPFLGPSLELLPDTAEGLQARVDAVQDARERVGEQLRLALQRRSRSGASSRLASRQSPSESAPGDVPAVFPFPEPIPHGPPSRRPASKQRCRSVPADAVQASLQVASSSEQSAVTGLDTVAAIFPFPEPIPRGPPARQQPRPAPSALSRQAAAARSPRRGGRASALSEELQGRAGLGPSFAQENRRRANAWMSQCVPEACAKKHEKPIWMQRRESMRQRRRVHNGMLQNLPTLPFDLWFEMKLQLEASGEVDAQAKNSLRLYYQELGAARREVMRASSRVSTSRGSALGHLSAR